MNTKEHETMKMRGSRDVSYLGHTVDEMVYKFMEEQGIPGLTLAIVQAPYIPRVVGYGLSDPAQRRLASANTMWPAGPISQAFAAVAVMQLYEDGALDLESSLGTLVPEVPKAWSEVTVLQMLRHASGLPDYRGFAGWSAFEHQSLQEILKEAAGFGLKFEPGTETDQSATNFLMLTEIVERVSKRSYHDFVTERQIHFLGLQHTGFAEDLDRFPHEDVSLSENVHQIFKKNGIYIDPVEPAASYDSEGQPVRRVDSSALKGFSDIWASARIFPSGISGWQGVF